MGMESINGVMEICIKESLIMISGKEMESWCGVMAVSMKENGWKDYPMAKVSNYIYLFRNVQN